MASARMRMKLLPKSCWSEKLRRAYRRAFARYKAVGLWLCFQLFCSISLFLFLPFDHWRWSDKGSFVQMHVTGKGVETGPKIYIHIFLIRIFTYLGYHKNWGHEICHAFSCILPSLLFLQIVDFKLFIRIFRLDSINVGNYHNCL